MKLAFLLEDGSTEFISRDIYKGNLPIKASIDAPAPNQLINSSTQVVRGWMWAEEGMGYMQVFLDNVAPIRYLCAILFDVGASIFPINLLGLNVAITFYTFFQHQTSIISYIINFNPFI